MSAAYCPNGHPVRQVTSGTTCPACAAPLYGQCRGGHGMWLTQQSCPTCGAALAGDGPRWTAPSWGRPPTAVTSSLSPDREARARGLLRPGEQLLWCGTPDPSVHLTRADVVVVPLSLLWAVLVASLFWTGPSFSAGPPPVFLAVWGTVVAAAGAYVAVGRFAVKAWRKRRTLYVLTDRRAIALVGRRSTERPWQGFPLTVSRHRGGGHVDVVFEAPPATGARLLAPSAFPYFAYANTGLDLVNQRRLLAFFDVADPDALLAALGHLPA